MNKNLRSISILIFKKISFIKTFKIFLSQRQNGSILLMSLLIMSGIVISASTIGIITIQNLQQSILVDHGILSHYAAESAAEDALYEIRKNNTSVSSISLSGNLYNTASWTRSITSTVPLVSGYIKKNDFLHIDLYNPDSSLTSLANPIRSILLSWTGSGSEWVEVQIISWSSSGVFGAQSTQLFSSASNPAVVNLQDSSSIFYRVRIKALYADISNMTITAYSALNASGSTVDIPARINMLATGSFGRSKQSLRVTMPQRSPLSGLFGYVIFSEEDLIKQ